MAALRTGIAISSLNLVMLYPSSLYADQSEMEVPRTSILPVSSLEGPIYSEALRGQLNKFHWQETAPPATAEGFALLKQHLHEALEQQPRIHAQRSRERESFLQVSEVRAERRPQVNAGFEYRNDIQRTDSLPDRGSRVDAVVTLSQLLFDFGASGQRLHAANLNADAAFWQTQASLEEEVLYAIRAHLDVIRITAQLELAEHNLLQHQRILDDIQLRRDAGAGSRADVLRAQSRLSEAQSRKVSLEGQLARATNAYQEAFFRPPSSLALTQVSVMIPSMEVEQLLHESFARNAMLKSGLFATQANNAEARAEQNARWPRLSVAVEGRQFDVNDVSNTDNDVALLFNLDYTPYSGGAIAARIGQAEERLRQSEFEQQTLLRELEREVRSAHTDVVSRLAELQAQSATVEAEEQALLAYREQFSIGRSSINDLLDAQRDLFQAASELVNRRLRWEEANFEKLAVTGQLLDAMEIRVEPQG